MDTNSTSGNNNYSETTEAHKSHWLIWLLIGLSALFLIIIIILRGLCSDVWYIKLLGLENKLCGNSSGVNLPQAKKTQTLSIEGNKLYISEGNAVDLGELITTAQQSSQQGLITTYFDTYYSSNVGCVQSVICNTSSVEPNKNFAVQSANPLLAGGIIRGATGQAADLLVLQNASGNNLSVFNAFGNLGVNTASPQTNLHVTGSEIVTGHAAVGPNSTLSDGLLVTPLPPPFSTLMARRTQYVAEKITDISTAPPFPGAFIAQGNELLLDPTTDPSALFFGGSYSAITTAAGNASSFGNLIGQIDGVVLKGSGSVTSAMGTISGVVNLDGSVVSNAVGHIVGSTNYDPTGVITSNNGLAVMSPLNFGTINENVGLNIDDQAMSFLGTGNNPLAGYNIKTSGAGLNKFGGNTSLNAENNAQMTADINSPYNAATRWPSTPTDSLPTALGQMGYAYSNGNIYITGGKDGGGAYSSVYYTKMNADKTLSGWTATTPLPVARFGHRSYIQNGYLYVVGGNSGGGVVSTVYYARLNADGSVGSWKTTTPIPAVREFFGGAEYNGYLYVVAGSDGFVPTSTVYYAKPNSDGSISSWTTSATPLPGAWKNSDAVVNNGTLYYLDVGGFAVKYATLNSDGSNNAWSTASTSPTFGTFDHFAFVNSGILYRVGGYLCGGTCNSLTTVATAKFLPNGDLDTWEENVSNLSSPWSGGAGINTNGDVFVIGGEPFSLSVASYDDEVYKTLTRKTYAAGGLDLLTISNSSGSAYGGAASLRAGDTEIVGDFGVLGDSLFNGNLSVLDSVYFDGVAQLGSDVLFDPEVAHSIKLQDSYNVATPGSALSILGSNGNGAAGGDVIIQAGTGTTDGDILLNPTTGNVGVHNSAPVFSLHVGDSTIADSTTLLRLEDTNSVCDFNANAGAPLCGSDETLKKNIVDLALSGLEKINALRVVQYNWQTDAEGDAAQTGFIAQEVGEVIPDLVKDGSWKDGSTRKFLSQSGMIPYLVKAIQEQQTQINELKNTPATFSVDVLGELAKANAVTLNGDLVVNGLIQASSNNTGTAKVPAGELKLKVALPRTFATKPSIVVSPNDFIDGSYRTTNVTSAGFEIELNKAQDVDVEFSWQAF